MAQLSTLPGRVRYGPGKRWASALRRLVVQATHRHGVVRFEGPVYVGPGFTLTMPGRSQFIVGPDVEFRRGFTCELHPGGRVTIGARTIFTYDTIIQCSTSIDIGEECMIGRVMITDGNHRFKDPDVPVREQGYDFRPLTIGREAALATHAMVYASLGDRVWVGANSVVTRDVPPYSLAVGAPARVVERFLPEGFEDEPAVSQQ